MYQLMSSFCSPFDRIVDGLGGWLTREQLETDGGSWSSPLQQDIVSKVVTQSFPFFSSSRRHSLIARFDIFCLGKDSQANPFPVLVACLCNIPVALGSPMENLRDGRG